MAPSYAEMDAATRDAFERGSKAVEEAKKRPCGLCLAGQRLHGDHLCKRCRDNLNETRREAGIGIAKVAR